MVQVSFPENIILGRRRREIWTELTNLCIKDTTKKDTMKFLPQNQL